MTPGHREDGHCCLAHVCADGAQNVPAIWTAHVWCEICDQRGKQNFPNMWDARDMSHKCVGRTENLGRWASACLEFSRGHPGMTRKLSGGMGLRGTLRSAQDSPADYSGKQEGLDGLPDCPTAHRAPVQCRDYSQRCRRWRQKPPHSRHITYQTRILSPLGELDRLPDFWPAEAAGDGDRSLRTAGTAVDGQWHWEGPPEKKNAQKHAKRDKKVCA